MLCCFQKLHGTSSHIIVNLLGNSPGAHHDCAAHHASYTIAYSNHLQQPHIQSKCNMALKHSPIVKCTEDHEDDVLDVVATRQKKFTRMSMTTMMTMPWTNLWTITARLTWQTLSRTQPTTLSSSWLWIIKTEVCAALTSDESCFIDMAVVLSVDVVDIVVPWWSEEAAFTNASSSLGFIETDHAKTLGSVDILVVVIVVPRSEPALNV